MIRLLPGDCREMLATLPADSVHCVVTSPPYYGLRDYGTAQWDGGDAACDHVTPRADRSEYKRKAVAPTDATHPQGGIATWTNRDAMPPRQCSCGATRVDRQIGLEASPDLYLAEMVRVFREVKRVLRPDGTCWVNMGDSYNTYAGNRGASKSISANTNEAIPSLPQGAGLTTPLLANKQLLMMPARLALALQADGWWLRSDIIWHKPNPMPESVTDRPTSAHEHVFLLAKAARYYYDADAVREDAQLSTIERDNYRRTGYAKEAGGVGAVNYLNPNSGEFRSCSGRNLRNVWTIATAPYSEAHFATFPPALAERCIRAGTKPGDTVLDPFAGAGTTLLVADRLQRDAIGIELSPDYTRMAMDRCRDDAPLFASPPPAEPPEDARVRDLFAESLAAD